MTTEPGDRPGVGGLRNMTGQTESGESAGAASPSGIGDEIGGSDMGSGNLGGGSGAGDAGGVGGRDVTGSGPGGMDPGTVTGGGTASIGDTGAMDAGDAFGGAGRNAGARPDLGSAGEALGGDQT